VHQERGDEIAFLGMAGLADLGPIEDFVERNGLDGFPHAYDADGDIWARFGTIGRSVFVFIDEDGTIEATGYGEYGDADKLDAKITELLSGGERTQ
jgi:hypothetical protein